MRKLLTFIVAIAIVGMYAASVAAVDWDFYGNARMKTFRTDVRYDDDTKYDDEDTMWDLNSISRIGATIKSGNVSGRFEYGHDSERNNVTLRRLYGTWDFGYGELLVGQDYTPVHHVGTQVFGNDISLSDSGGLFSRESMVQVKIDGFKLALVKPSNGSKKDFYQINADDTISIAANPDDTDTILPKIEISYKFAADNFAVEAFGGYNSYDVVDGNDKEEEVTSFVYGISGEVNVGPVKASGMFFAGQNVNTYGLLVPLEGNINPIYENGKIIDNDGFGYYVTIDYKINDMFAVGAGYGAINFEYDMDGAKEDETCAYYLQVPITLADGVCIVPEIGKYDYKENGFGDDEGDMIYYGAKWQINF